MTDSRATPQPDLIEQIPDPDTVRSWLSDSIRRAELLRSLLRVAIRKAAFDRPAAEPEKEVAFAK